MENEILRQVGPNPVWPSLDELRAGIKAELGAEALAEFDRMSAARGPKLSEPELDEDIRRSSAEQGLRDFFEEGK